MKETGQDFQAAIRRFSQRKKRQMGVATIEIESGKCANLKSGFFAKLKRQFGAKC